MTLIRKLALALCLALLCSSYSNSQSLDPATGLSLNSTGNVLNLGGGLPWSGTVTGVAGGSNGGPGPAYNPGTGNIIFSYGLNTASQIVAVNKALATAGTDIQLSGYKYSWQIHNDLTNYASNRGTLTGNVSLVGKDGTALESYNYNYNQNLPSFTTFSGTQFFNNRYTTSAADSLQVSFTGQSQNFWAGYYGPRVHVNDVSLLYTVKPVAVDPCISDPLYSPACSGYALATVKNSLLGSTVSNASATSYVPATNYASPAPAAAPPAVADAAPALAQASPQQQSQQPTQQGLPSQQQQPGQDPNQNPGVAQDNPAQPSPQQAGPAPTNPQPAGGPSQTATASATQSSAGSQQAGPSSNGPSKLAMSVVKTAQANDRATQQTAVQNASKAFENTQQSSQAASNLAITMNQDMSANSATAAAQFSSQSTQSSMQPIAQSMPGLQQAAGSSATSSSAPKGSASSVTETSVQSGSGTGLTISRNPFAYNPLAIANTSNMGLPAIAQSAPAYQPKLQERAMELDTPQASLTSFGGTGRAGNPLSEILMQQRFELMQSDIAQSGSAVNKNVQPNELAGGVDIAAMASTPASFNTYSFALKDTAFYESREVYKNQRTVDNERVLRGLTRGSDGLHQQMVDQQYLK